MPHDIVERLRALEIADCDEAANTITALRANVDLLVGKGYYQHKELVDRLRSNSLMTEAALVIEKLSRELDRV